MPFLGGSRSEQTWCQLLSLGQTLHIPKSTSKAWGFPMAWLGVVGPSAECNNILTGLANKCSKGELLTELKGGRMGLAKFLIFALFSGLPILTRHLISFWRSSGKKKSFWDFKIRNLSQSSWHFNCCAEGIYLGVGLLMQCSCVQT